MNNYAKVTQPTKLNVFPCFFYLLFLLIPIEIAFANPVTVFGPVVYEHNRKINQPVNNFSVADTDANYLLIIDNGNFGETKPAKGKIFLNGIAINLNKKKSHIEIPVSLRPENSVMAKLKGKQGRKVYVEIQLIDNSATNTVFGSSIYKHIRRHTFPVENFNVDDPNAAYLLIIDNGNFGETKPAKGKLYLNGVATKLSQKNKHIEIPVNLLYENTVTIKLKGKHGRKVYVEIQQVGNFRPVADAGPDQTPFVGDVVLMDGGSSSDGDGDVLTYAWSILSKPTGSSTTLINPNTVSPSLQIDRSGNYDIQLVVNDGISDSLPDTVQINTLNSAPLADAGPDQTPFVGDNVILDGLASSDIDSDPLTFSWLLTAKPLGSLAILNQANTSMPDFDVDQPGHYNAELIVNDGKTDSSPDNVAIDTLNSRPVAAAGIDQSVLLGQK